MIVAKIALTLFGISFCAGMSGALFPPGDIPRQLTVVALWYAVGIGTGLVWVAHR